MSFTIINLRQNLCRNRQETNDIPHSKNHIIKKTELSAKEETMTYNDEELNNLLYESAMKFDKRNYWQYYISLLRTKYDLISTFFNNNDYNSKIVKKDLFIFNFAFFCTINALFFNDNTMHKIYEDKGSFNFLYQLPQIIYSSIISIIFGILIKMLALSEDQILDFKNNKEKKT